MSTNSRRASVAELVAAARRDLEHAEAALTRAGDYRPDDLDDLITLILLARAARTADDATFALLDSRPRPPRHRTLIGLSDRSTSGHSRQPRDSRTQGLPTAPHTLGHVRRTR